MAFQRDFYFGYRLVVSSAAVAWNALICWRPGGSLLIGLRDFTLEMLPVIALVVLARVIGNRVILIAAIAIHAMLIAFATRASFVGADPVPLLVAPLLTLVAVVPGALLAGRILRKSASQ